ncbi:MAG: hypothetical protein VR65_03630 [Desulfobulbaceae bacterium BRH_c16a]|nr:MAG: hypothetical protein VR65_03630 [Desulfobulbaceae bacterium BRH_c16a]
MKCQLRQGGLFLPLDDHIEVYCKSPYYTQCTQYSLHLKNTIQLVDKKAPRNRRKYERVVSHHPVTLVKLFPSGEIVAHFSIIGRTLDLSKGGLRLATEKPLINDTMVRFSFEESFPESLRKGKGEIAWSNKIIDEPGYQAGISFKDDHLINTMGVYLGLYHNHS